MKAINACIHHTRVAVVVETLIRAGFRNISLQDIDVFFGPLSKSEFKCWVEVALGVAGIRLSMVCEDHAVESATRSIIKETCFVWIHVVSVDHTASRSGHMHAHDILSDPTASETAITSFAIPA